MTSRQRPTQLALIPTVVPDVRQAEPHREEPLRRAPTSAAEVRLARPPDKSPVVQSAGDSHRSRRHHLHALARRPADPGGRGVLLPLRDARARGAAWLAAPPPPLAGCAAAGPPGRPHPARL